MKKYILAFFIIWATNSFSVEKTRKFWVLKSSGANQKRISEVKNTLIRCSKGLFPYFKKGPDGLLVIAYSSREKFVDGLVKELGFSEKSALYFRYSSAPRPMQGKMLVPPDQKLYNICHELIHAYLESNTNRNHLIKEKWFDEGFATYISFKIMTNRNFDSIFQWFKKETRDQYIPIERMRSEKQWRQLHKDKKLRNIAYIQANFMMRYFLSKYSKNDFRKILEIGEEKSLEEAFKDVTNLNIDKFHQEWLFYLKSKLIP